MEPETGFSTFHKDLRDNHRIKLNCDYAIAFKYGAAHLLACEIYLETIQKVATMHKVNFVSVHTYK